MRLLNVHTIKLETFHNEEIPKFAILSHTWLRNDQEVTFAQIQTPDACTHMEGFKKVEFLCEQARREGYNYFLDRYVLHYTDSPPTTMPYNKGGTCRR
ncbi:hypothetical protein DM02DRAFT_439733 [Periconia macrospinosa]|uniref:Uncharacterized protein n=1 Tax=Periconia macrospinosa TaxID=97972 RepID=A0A2V1DMD2_9PLEO|nr:hypothetical protein DM02DRAFT_439733 [Periconia macrospinosa]